MANHDYSIANQSFPSFRTDLNNALAAIASTNSGTSAPSTTFANQLWYDSSANILYIRNEDNDANIPLLQLDQSGDVAATLATIIDVLDKSGTNTAGTDLTIRAGAGTGTGAGGNIILQTANAGSSGSSVNSHATAVTIDDAGQVGIGISAPDGKVHAFSADASQTANAAANQFVAENSGNAGMSILSGNTSTGNVYFADNGDNAVGFIQYKHDDNYLRFGTAGSERMRVLSGGGLTFNGDTATANALDDYEEGTFTPTYAFSGGGGSFSYSIQVGTYTKIGRFVFAQVRIRGQKSGTGSGVLQINGLPFTASNVTNLFGTGAIGFTNNWNNRPMGVYIEANNTAMTLTKGANSSNTYSDLDTTILDADLDTGSTSSNDLIFTIFFTT